MEKSKMKIILGAFLILMTGSLSAQDIFSLANNGGLLPKDNAIFNIIVSQKGGKQTLTYDDVQGTPYLTKTEEPARISNVKELTPVKYNSYKDEFEFQQNGKNYVLPKLDTYSQIEIIDPKIRFDYISGEGELSGYFVNLVDGEYKLYKKIRTKFIDLVPSPNSYIPERPAKFHLLDPYYTIKVGNELVKITKDFDDFYSKSGSKKAAIKSFVKQNKIKYNKEEDLIKLVNFLNQK